MKKNYVTVDNTELDAFISKTIDGPFEMLNLLKFKDLIPETQQSGKGMFKEYMIAASPFLEQAGAKVVYKGKYLESLIGPTEKEWDMIIIVSYPSKAHFHKMVKDPNYPAHLRKAALSDCRLILCK